MDKDVNTFGNLPGVILRIAIGAFKFLDRHNLAPKNMIDSDPLYCSLFLTNMGSVGMELGPHHHLFEWGNASLFCSISQYMKRPIVDSEGKIIVRDIMDLIISWDDRIADGLYGQKSAELLKELIENPSQLENLPEIPQEILDELKLEPKKLEEIDKNSDLHEKINKAKNFA